MKNQHLRAALDSVCKKEGISQTSWATTTTGINPTQLAKLSYLGLRDEALQALCKEANWQYPSSSLELTIAILNDTIVRVGRSPEEFNVHSARGNKANIPLESAIRKLEEFASRSNGAFELIQMVAGLISHADEMAKNARGADGDHADAVAEHIGKLASKPKKKSKTA